MRPPLHVRIEALKTQFIAAHARTASHVALTKADEADILHLPGLTADDKSQIASKGVRSWINTNRSCKLLDLYVMFDAPELRVGDRRGWVVEAAE